jgi:hypothetical protein
MVRSRIGQKQEKHAVRWETLPHARLALEIAQAVAYRAPQEAHYEIRLEELTRKLPDFCNEDHCEYTRLVSAEINRELRICRDVYRQFLSTLNNKSRTVKWDVALDFAVAPRASLALRREIFAYLSNSKVDPLTAETFLAFNVPIVIPLRNGEVPPSEKQSSLEGLVSSCVSNEAFQELRRRFKRESFIVGGPFALPHVLRRAMSYGINLPDIAPIHEASEIWISGAGRMWDSVLREVIAHKVQIELEECSDAMAAVEVLPRFDCIAGPLYAETSERYTTIPDDVWANIGAKIDRAEVSLEDTLESEGKRALRDLAQRGIVITSWQEALICRSDFGVLESKVVVRGAVKYRGMLNRHAKRSVYRARDRYQKVLDHIYEDRIPPATSLPSFRSKRIDPAREQ